MRLRKRKPIVTPDMDDLEATEALLAVAAHKPGVFDPEVWRHDMLRQIRMLWCVFALLVPAEWGLVIFRLGWSGVDMATVTTGSVAWSGFWIWYSPRLKNRTRHGDSSPCAPRPQA